jgi:hypothetical protein
MDLILQGLRPLPAAVVLMGRPCARPVKITDTVTQIFIVPGIDAPGPEILPKIPVKSCYFSAGKGPRPVVLYNPARLSLFNREVVFYTGNWQQTLSKNALLARGYSLDQDFKALNRAVAETMLFQGHLCPLDTITQPVFAGLD